MLNRDDITHVDWQMERTPDGQAVLGAIVTGIDDLSQQIRQCILTPKGSVPLNPEKGCDLEAYRDRPLNVRQLLVVAEVRSALERDVPDITIEGINLDLGFSGITIEVTWIPAQGPGTQVFRTGVEYV